MSDFLQKSDCLNPLMRSCILDGKKKTHDSSLSLRAIFSHFVFVVSKGNTTRNGSPVQVRLQKISLCFIFQCPKGSCNPCFYEESHIKYFFLSLLSVSLEASLHILCIMLQDDVQASVKLKLPGSKLMTLLEDEFATKFGMGGGAWLTT